MRGWPTWLLFALTGAQLFAYSYGLNRAQPVAREHDSPVHEFLRQRRDANDNGGGFLVARGLSKHGPYNLPGGTLAAEHIRDLNFYTFVDNKSDLPIRRLYGDAFILRGFVCDALPDDARLELPWWDLIGLRYVLATMPMKHAGQRVGPAKIGGRDYFVYERPNCMPRAWVVPDLRVIDSETTAIAALASKDLDPRASVIVDEADVELLGRIEPNPSSLAALREVSIDFENAKRVTVRVAAGDPGYLVLNDTFFAGWDATINGQPTPIARGNLFQRVIRLPGEQCDVQFRFRGEGLATGGVLGAIGGALLLGLLVIARRSRPRRGPAAA